MQIRSVHDAQLTVDVLQDLRVGLVFGSMTTQRSLTKKIEIFRLLEVLKYGEFKYQYLIKLSGFL